MFAESPTSFQPLPLDCCLRAKPYHRAADEGKRRKPLRVIEITTEAAIDSG